MPTIKSSCNCQKGKLELIKFAIRKDISLFKSHLDNITEIIHKAQVQNHTE